MAAQSPSIGIREIVFDSLTAQSLVLAGIAAASAFLLTRALGWPVWAITIATVLPWLPLVARQTRWTAGVSAPLALFYALVVGQGAHFGEHLAQMVQIHALGRHGMAAMGLISPLNMEWVHFLWNTLVFLALLLLVRWFGANRWVWLSLVFAAWHEIEHVYIMWIYLRTGVEGDPGLLSKGGAIGGGLPLTRPDLHFLYNLAEITPIIIAFAVQLRRMRRDALDAGDLAGSQTTNPVRREAR